ncbi:hypothetical protein HMPREF1861_00677 [Corynebacterium kroppenstedtii]|nr:hypothetical protein HMPREF1861_00677 [Corynebacterium kroppenstedtii]
MVTGESITFFTRVIIFMSVATQSHCSTSDEHTLTGRQPRSRHHSAYSS